MLEFEESAVCRAPAIEVWKFLHDPVRFTEWFAGVSRVETTPQGARLYTDAEPDFPIPTLVTAGRGGGEVMFKCLVTQDVFRWTLEPHADGCRVTVRVGVADSAEGRRLQERRDAMVASLPRLVAVAEAAV